MSGASSRIAPRISPARANSMSSGISTLAAIRPPRALGRSAGRLTAVGALAGDVVELRRLVEQGLHRGLDSGSSTPWSAKTMVPTAPVPWPPKLSSRMSKPVFDSTSGRWNSSRKALPAARDRESEDEHAQPEAENELPAASTRCRVGEHARSWQGSIVWFSDG